MAKANATRGNSGRPLRAMTLWLAIGIVSWSQALWACNIPVFRYALENWQPDTFQVLVVSSQPLSENDRLLLNRFQELAASAEKPANLQIVSIDLSQQNVQERLREELRGEAPDADTARRLDQYLRELPSASPQMVVFYPKQWGQIAWSEAFHAESIERLVDSPLRQEISERLLGGDSAVWVLLECGRAADDQAAWERLEAELRSAEQVVKLPERELIETDDFYRADVPIELKVKFSAVRLSRENSSEAAFRSLLLGSEPDLAEFNEPIAIPIYGRGRSYFALVGKGIQEQTIRDNSQFLCGACSCQVKQDNPGMDMLMAVNWEERVVAQGSTSPPLPELTGVGALELAALPSRGKVDGGEASGVTRVTEGRPVQEVAPSTASDNGQSVEGHAAAGSETQGKAGSLSAGGTADGGVADDVAAGESVSFTWSIIAMVCGGAMLAVAILAIFARGL